MAILRIKGADGTWQEIPAISGGGGDDKTVEIAYDSITVTGDSNKGIAVMRPAVINIPNGNVGEFWEKWMLVASKQSTLNMGNRWRTIDTFSDNNNLCRLVWNYDMGYITTMYTNNSLVRPVQGTVSLVDSPQDVIIKRGGEVIYTLAKGAVHTVELAVGDVITSDVGGTLITMSNCVYIDFVANQVAEAFLGFSVSVMCKVYTQDDPYVSQGGRKLYRHSSGMGTVMEFDDGQDRKVLVLDAQYRAKELKMTSSDTDTSLPNCSTYKNTNNTTRIDGSDSQISPSDCASLTDATLNSLWVNSIDANTSKYNTDVWLTQPDCEAATHCRSIVVDGVGCDIPNIQTLMRIFCEANVLDVFDPTISSNPDLKLSVWLEPYSTISSTEFDEHNNRWVGYWGDCSVGGKNDSYGVIPVLELREPKNGTITTLYGAVSFEDASGNTVTLEPDVATTCTLYVGCKVEGVIAGVEGSGVTFDENGYVTAVQEGFNITIIAQWVEQYPLLSEGGRKLYRHESGMGTVIEFNDGQDQKVLVLDAQYRANTMLSDDIDDYASVGASLHCIDGNVWNNGFRMMAPDGTQSYDEESADYYATPDSELNRIWSDLYDSNTSRYNTDQWLSIANSEAVIQCRNNTVNGVGCDISNFQTLLRIVCEGRNLDLLDPSLKDYPSFALSNNSTSKDIVSSTMMVCTEMVDPTPRVYYLTIAFTFSRDRWSPNTNPTNENGIVTPVLELE